jgi:hypothetical protein
MNAERAPHPRAASSSRRRSGRLGALLGTVAAVALAACTAPADPRPFADATAALSSAVKASGQAVESNLRASSLPNADEAADRLRQTWSVRVAVMEQAVTYADGLRQIYNTAADSGKIVRQIAGDVTAIAAAAGLVMPPAAAIGAGVDGVALIYQNINNARAANSIQESLEFADRALTGIAQHLERDTSNLRDILVAVREQAVDDVIDEDAGLTNRFQAARDELARLTAAPSNLSAEELQRVSVMTELASSQAALLVAREARLAQTQSQFAAQMQLIDAAGSALTDWAAAHRRLVLAVRERRPVSVDSLVQTTTELRELIRKVREQ